MTRLARIFVGAAALVTLIGSNLADWNETHLFSEQWSPHARFHGAWMIVAFSLLSLYCLYLVWSRPGEQPARTRTAVVIQACIWSAFFPALLVPGGALADPGKSLFQIAGLEVNFYGALGQLAVLTLSLALMAARAPRDPGIS
jgi:Family of unknown function (DUF6640)